MGGAEGIRRARRDRGGVICVRGIHRVVARLIVHRRMRRFPIRLPCRSPLGYPIQFCRPSPLGYPISGSIFFVAHVVVRRLRMGMNPVNSGPLGVQFLPRVPNSQSIFPGWSRMCALRDSCVCSSNFGLLVPDTLKRELQTGNLRVSESRNAHDPHRAAEFLLAHEKITTRLGNTQG